MLASIGTIVDALELVSARGRNEAAFRWDVLSTLSAGTSRRSASFWFVELGLRPSIQVLRILVAASAAIAMAVAPGTVVGPALAAACVVLQVTVHNRLVFGLDGADQMLTIVWAGVAISGASHAAAFTLIGGQALLAYYAAGVAKLAGPEWRSGRAVERVVRTATHGSRTFASLVAIEPLGRLATWGTIAFEIGAPGLLLLGEAGGLAFVVIALVFHGSIAWGMGLNNFVWAFAAALPALYFAAAHLSVLG